MGGSRYEVIFQVHHGERGWLDYCRESSPHKDNLNPTNNWAKDQCAMLEKRELRPFRFLLELWK